MLCRQDVLLEFCTDPRFDEDTLFIIFEEDFRFTPDVGDPAWTQWTQGHFGDHSVQYFRSEPTAGRGGSKLFCSTRGRSKLFCSAIFAQQDAQGQKSGATGAPKFLEPKRKRSGGRLRGPEQSEP